MISEIGTTISTISLMLQLYDRHGAAKVKDVQEYRDKLRSLVSTLYFAKAIHNLAHTILDLNCVSVFDIEVHEVGLTGFQRSFNSSFGQFVLSKIDTDISPNLPQFKSIIMDKPASHVIRGLPNTFVASVNALNYCYPTMISTYEMLAGVIGEMRDEVVNIKFDLDYAERVMKNFDVNRGRWKHYIELNNRNLLSFADQTILNGITVLDALFLL